MANRGTVICNQAGQIVEGNDDLRGLTCAQVTGAAKALDELVKGRPQKSSILTMLVARGWLSNAGRVTSKGERFRDEYRKISWITAPGSKT